MPAEHNGETGVYRQIARRGESLLEN